MSTPRFERGTVTLQVSGADSAADLPDYAPASAARLGPDDQTGEIIPLANDLATLAALKLPPPSDVAIWVLALSLANV